MLLQGRNCEITSEIPGGWGFVQLLSTEPGQQISLFHPLITADAQLTSLLEGFSKISQGVGFWEIEQN